MVVNMINLNFDNANTEVTKEEILSKVSELDIWSKYVSGFVSVDKSFKSDLYSDKKASCRIYYNNLGNLVYKDHGNGDFIGNCFDYIQKKYNCTFHESLNIIARDFNIKNLDITINPKLLLTNDIGHETKSFKTKSRIDIVKQNYTSYDYDYWNQFDISISNLEKEEVASVKYAYLHTHDNQYLYEYRKSNPIYAYKEYNYMDGSFAGYRLYFPNNNGNRFINNSNKKALQGYDKLPECGELLILTKSRKDCICYKLTCGIPAVSMSSETTIPDDELIATLTGRFDRVVINLDNDEEGIKNTIKIADKYKLEHFYIDGAKDLSDLIKLKGSDHSKKQIIKKLDIKI